MLTGERFLPETIFVPDGNVVNRLFDVLLRDADTALAEMFSNTLMQLQSTWFAAGRRSHCPACASDALARKGWRRRILKTSRGSMEVAVLQAKCKICGRICRPMNDLVGLPFARRILDEFIDKAIRLGINLSFAKSAALLGRLTSCSLSAEGIRNKIAQAAASIEFSSNVNDATVFIDSTKVKAADKERGIPVHLAISARQGPRRAGRPTIQKRLLHLNVGIEQPLRTKLEQLDPPFLVYDGGPHIGDIAANRQRCRWHLVYQLKHYLWQDGVPFDLRGHCQKVLRHILWDKKRGRKRLEYFINDLRGLGLEKSALHLSQARDEAFTHYGKPGFSYATTSPIEREMRELNRRADVGVRWSAKGIENVLKVLFHYRLNESTA